MKCIAQKSEMLCISIVLFTILLCIAIGCSINMPEIQSGCIPQIILLSAALIGFGIYNFSIPKEIILYDEANQKVIINKSRKESITVNLSDIRYIDTFRARGKDGSSAKIILKNGEEIMTPPVSENNLIKELNNLCK